MKILAIDTTAVASSVAVADADTDGIKTFAQQTVCNKLTHSQTLMPSVDSVLAVYGCNISDIDLFAVSVGPGSFTGVRIGVATVKGLAFGRRECCGVSSLEALAMNVAGFGGIVCPVMDARREQFYYALFDESGRLTPDRCSALHDIESELYSLGKPVMLVGDGAKLFASLCPNKNYTVAPAASLYQNALSVAIAALNGTRTDAASLKPLYLRAPQAEREYLNREEHKDDCNRK